MFVSLQDLSVVDESSVEDGQHEAMMTSLLRGFTGRRALVKRAREAITSRGLVILEGKPGRGKSALMVRADKH